MSDSPGKRLALFRNSLGMNQRVFASSLGTSHGTVAFIESDERLPSRGFLEKISNIYGISADWLLNGQGEMQRAFGPGFKGRTATIEPPDYAKPGHGDLRIDGYDCVRLRRMDLSVSAGSGVIALDGPDAAPLVVPVAWVQKLRINADVTVLVSVKGDSMAPAIPDGAFVLVHLMEKQVLKAGVYAFNLDGHSYVKRLVPSDANGEGRPEAISIISDNPTYQPKVLTGRKLNDLKVVGRVRAVLALI